MENAMQKPLIAVLIASAFLSINAQAADLIQVYKQALANDATFASARASLTAGREKGPQGRAALLPTIGFDGSIVKSNSDSSPWNEGAPLGTGFVTGSSTDNHVSTNTLTLVQPLFRWANWQTYQQSKLLQSISEAQFAQAQQDLITRVAQAYFDVLAAEDSLELNRAQKTATTEQLASAKRNFEVGTQTITDTHEAQAAYDLVIAQEFAAIADLENKRSALQNIIGAAPTTLAPLKPGVVLATPSPAAIEPWVTSAETQNYGVVSAELAFESSKRDIQKSRAGHYPTLDLIANARRTDSSGQYVSSGVRNDKAIGFQYSVPIFNGFAVNSRVRESIALEDKARNDLEATRRNAAQNARTAFQGVNSGLAQVRALQAAEVSSTSALESNKLGYQVGVRINIDVLNAQGQLYLTRRNLSRARYDTILSGLRLKSAAGSLREADLEPVNALLVK
jgi:outer membrane protein